MTLDKLIRSVITTAILAIPPLTTIDTYAQTLSPTTIINQQGKQQPTTTMNSLHPIQSGPNQGQTPIFPRGYHIGHLPDGSVAIRGEQELIYPEPKPYSSMKLEELNKEIKQNPNQAAPYVAKADKLIQAKATPQTIINTLETALKQPKLEGTNREIATLYQELSSRYFHKGEINKAYNLKMVVKKIDPNYPGIDYDLKNMKKMIK